MPPLLPPSSERLVRHGLFLIEDGQTMFLWIGRDAVPQLVMDVFDLPSYDQLPSGKVRWSLPPLSTRPDLDPPWRTMGLMHHSPLDHTSTAGQPLLPAHQRGRRQNARASSRSVLAPPLPRAGRRRASAPPMGPQRTHTRSGGSSAELSAVC